jgi:hypothetical protein
LAHHKPFRVTGFHSCDKEVGLKVLTGDIELTPSVNTWDWLGQGIYFWEQNPQRALEYAEESAKGTQFNKKRIHTPFVIGATIELGHCLNLVEPDSINLLKEGYKGLSESYAGLKKTLPQNKDNNRRLDCAVIQFIQQSQEKKYDTIRCPFQEGEDVYPGANFTSRLHIQICVLNADKIEGYFLPRPIKQFNPYLEKEFSM